MKAFGRSARSSLVLVLCALFFLLAMGLTLLSGGVYLVRTGLDWGMAWPYLAGGLAGGFVGGKLFTRVPAVWLRRLFAAVLVYGGVRYLL